MAKGTIKDNCFAYNSKNRSCHALKEIDCRHCKFYKHRKEIKNNPFYGYSWKNKEEHARIMEEKQISKELVLW